MIDNPFYTTEASSAEFSELLKTPGGIEKFERFCLKEHNAENIHFWLSVEE